MALFRADTTCQGYDMPRDELIRKGKAQPSDELLRNGDDMLSGDPIRKGAETTRTETNRDEKDEQGVELNSLAMEKR